LKVLIIFKSFLIITSFAYRTT